MSSSQNNPPQSSGFFKRLLPIFLGILLVAAIIFVGIRLLGDQPLFTRAAPTPDDVITVLTPAPLPILPGADDIIFQDNFDATQGTWELSPFDQATYAGGAILLNDTRYDGMGWARPHLRFDDFVLDVDCRWLGGAVGGAYGLHFRHQDDENFYAFTIKNDGWYTLVKNVAGNRYVVSESFSPAIERSGNANHLHIEANGSNLRFFVNNIYLMDVQSPGLETGDVMLITQTVEGMEQMQVGFDNLVIAFYPSGT